MQYTLKNRQLEITCSGHGAELISVRAADGYEYLWQADPAYWSSHAPQLFPLVGRLTDGKYTLDGSTYAMGTHGYFRRSEVALAEQTENSLVFRQCSDDVTRAMYPRDYIVTLSYILYENRVEISFGVENTGGRTMYFGYGGHPGFNVPLQPGAAFEDCRLEFSAPCSPLAVGMSDACFVQGPDTPFPLQKDRYLPLRHDLFDRDAVILRNMAGAVTLGMPGGRRWVRLEYPQMRYLGLWHKPRCPAPYLCIEPWTSLPARQGVVEALEQKPDLLQLQPGKRYLNCWSITFGV